MRQPAADRAQLVVEPLGRQVAQPRGGFGLAVHDKQPHVGKGPPDFADQRRRVACRPPAAATAARETAAGRSGVLRSRILIRGRHARQPGATGLLHFVEHLFGEEEAVVQHQRAAGHQVRVQQRCAEAIVERQDGHDAVAGPRPT